MLGYRDGDGTEHIALTMGDLGNDNGAGPPTVRLHSECLTGDGFGSYRCDCGEQLDAALAQIAAVGRGAVIYLRGHEGRGIGLLEKLRTYELQDDGLDTLDANVELGHSIDARSYDAAAGILRDLGVDTITLLSNNPAKALALHNLGIKVVGRDPLWVPSRPENARYIDTKINRMGHAAPPQDDCWADLLQMQTPAVAVGPTSRMLVDRYGPLVRHDGPLVIAQMGQSADGFIASRTGDGAELTSDADREHLHRLRALVDAVVVGVNTVAADDCQLTVRAVPGPNPVRVLIDPNRRIPPHSKVLQDNQAPTLWLVDARTAAAAPTPSTAAHVEVVPMESHDGTFEPEAILRELAARGLHRVLVEGGGRTVSRFVQADVLDYLFLTVAPTLLGDGVPGIRFQGTDLVRDALRPPVHRLLIDNDTCLRFDLSHRATPPTLGMETVAEALRRQDSDLR